MVTAMLSWGFGFFGTSVYLHVTHEANRLSVAALSSAILMSLIASTCAQIAVGNALAKHGPWFDRHQGPAESSAMLGASLGGMLAVPTMIYSVGVIPTSLVYGLILGNIKAMGPITLRQEFGAAAFGKG